MIDFYLLRLSLLLLKLGLSLNDLIKSHLKIFQISIHPLILSFMRLMNEIMMTIIIIEILKILKLRDSGEKQTHMVSNKYPFQAKAIQKLFCFY